MNFHPDLSQPWAILPSAISKVEALHGVTKPTAPSPPKAAPYQIRNGVALLSISGVLLRSCPDWLAAFADVTSCETVAANLESALSDSTVNGLCLVINSPGGQVSGVCELASLISAAGLRKRTQSFAHGLCASGAYWLASATQRIDASPSTLAGSVGVLGLHLDTSAANTAAGVKLEIFRSGPLKAAGVGGEKLTDDQRASIQSTIDDSFALFRSHVQKERPGVAPSVFDGATFLAQKAQQLRLIDGIGLSLDQVLQGNAPGPVGNQIMSFESQWESSEELRAEFPSAKNYAAYMNGVSSGRIRDYGRQETLPARADHRQAVPSSAASAEDFGSQYDSNPAIRAEFISRSSYVAYRNAQTTGRVRDYSGNFPPVRSRVADVPLARSDASTGNDWREKGFISQTSFEIYQKALTEGRIR